MHPYVPHLLADIEAAHRDKEKTMGETPTSIEQHLEEVERWVAGNEPRQTLGYYCGLKTSDFPPAKVLDEDDLIRVCEAFRQLLFSWNADVSLPDELPLHLRYHLVVNTLNEEFQVINSGRIVFDYCSGYAPDCPLKEYCPCLQFWNESDDTTTDA